MLDIQKEKQDKQGKGEQLRAGTKQKVQKRAKQTGHGGKHEQQTKANGFMCLNR